MKHLIAPIQVNAGNLSDLPQSIKQRVLLNAQNRCSLYGLLRFPEIHIKGVQQLLMVFRIELLENGDSPVHKGVIVPNLGLAALDHMIERHGDVGVEIVLQVQLLGHLHRHLCLRKALIGICQFRKTLADSGAEVHVPQKLFQRDADNIQPMIRADAGTPLAGQERQTAYELAKRTMPPLDAMTSSDLAWKCYRCDVVGTFYEKEDQTCFAGDQVEILEPSAYRIYHPGPVLPLVVNGEYVQQLKFRSPKDGRRYKNDVVDTEQLLRISQPEENAIIHAFPKSNKHKILSRFVDTVSKPGHFD